MGDEFKSSWQKVEWAEKRLNDLNREIEGFLRPNPYEKVIEPDAEKPDHQVHKVKLTKVMPPSICHITSEVAQHLRNALDNAGYSIAVAIGRPEAKNTNFPFARSVADMAKSIGRAKDLPQEIQSLFCGFQPYLGGDELLWALNEIAVAEKHKVAIPIGQGVLGAGVNASGTGFFSMPQPHVWDRTKNEMVLITLGPGAEYKYDLKFHLFVAFNDIEVVDGQPVFRILYLLGRKVASIIGAIEAESRRLGFVK